MTVESLGVLGTFLATAVALGLGLWPLQSEYRRNRKLLRIRFRYLNKELARSLASCRDLAEMPEAMVRANASGPEGQRDMESCVSNAGINVKEVGLDALTALPGDLGERLVSTAEMIELIVFYIENAGLDRPGDGRARRYAHARQLAQLCVPQLEHALRKSVAATVPWWRRVRYRHGNLDGGWNEMHENSRRGLEEHAEAERRNRLHL